MWTVTSSRETGLMTKPMGMECTSMRMERSTRATGKTICKRDTELKFGPITQDMKAITNKGKSMERELTCGMMDLFTRVNGARTKYKDL